MIFIYKIDGTAVSVFNKPRIQLSSRDKSAIFQYTARSLTLSILDTAVIDEDSRLEVYMDSAIAANLIWTGDIDWDSRKFDSKTNKVSVTFLPDVVALKNKTFVETYSYKFFPDVLDDIVTAMGAGWSWESSMELQKIYTIESFKMRSVWPDLDLSHDDECFLLDDTDTDYPYVKHRFVAKFFYSRVEGTDLGGPSSPAPSTYSQVVEPHDVTVPLIGNAGYGVSFTNPFYQNEHIYYIVDGDVHAYGPNRQIISSFSVSYDCPATSIIRDVCQFADAYFYVLDKTIYIVHRHANEPKEISAFVISRKTHYAEAELTLDYSVDYGITSTAEGYLDDYYSTRYALDRTLEDLVLIQADGVLFPGDELVLNGTEEGTVNKVSFEGPKMVVEVDKLVAT